MSLEMQLNHFSLSGCVLFMAEAPCFLLAEDSECDVLLVRKAMSQAGMDSPLFVVRDGEEAIAYLNGEGKFADRSEYPMPDLLFLDLAMPKINGFEVLQWIRQQPGLSDLRVIVLTSSQNIHDMKTAYLLGANSFLRKPINFKDLFQISRFLPVRFLLPNEPREIPRSSPDPG